VIDSETQRLLSGRVAFNLDIAGAPSIGPSCLVLLDDLAPADLSGHAESFRCDAARIRILCISSGHSSKARNTNCLTRTRLPMPGPHERARSRWHNLGTVDLQRQRSSHCDAFTRVLGPPHAEILLNPLCLEPDAQALKRSFYCDLNLSFLDF